MRHHAYVIAGEEERTAAHIERYIENQLGMRTPRTNPDVLWHSFALLGTEDARTIIQRAYRSAAGDAGSVLVLRAGRFFHEAQNALLKVFEEPPPDTTIILSLPSEGILLPTLRSRLQPLPEGNAVSDTPPYVIARQFLEGTPEERAKYIGKLVERSKADKDNVKQEARIEAVQVLEGICHAAYTAREHSGNPTQKAELSNLLIDLTAFMPLLHERSASLKLIFEHLLLVIPTELRMPQV